MVASSQQQLDAIEATLDDVAIAIEMLHAATLVHDDVIDEAETRRGQPAVHREHGREVALLVGDLYVARCGVHLANAGEPRAAAELWGALDRIVRGEIDQRGHRYDLAQTSDDYLLTIARKTASLLEAASVAGVAVAGADQAQAGAARGYANHLGLAFQLSTTSSTTPAARMSWASRWATTSARAPSPCP